MPQELHREAALRQAAEIALAEAAEARNTAEEARNRAEVARQRAAVEMEELRKALERSQAAEAGTVGVCDQVLSLTR